MRRCCRATKDPAGFNIIDVFAWGAIGHALGYAALAIISLNSAGINPGQAAAPLPICMHVCLGYAACPSATCSCESGLLLAFDSMQSTGCTPDLGPSDRCSSQVLNVSRCLMEAHDADVASCPCKGLREKITQHLLLTCMHPPVLFWSGLNHRSCNLTHCSEIQTEAIKFRGALSAGMWPCGLRLQDSEHGVAQC